MEDRLLNQRTGSQTGTGRRWTGMGALLATVILGACTAVAPINPPIERADPDQGYRVGKMLKRTHESKRDVHTLFLLTFSGGGTRAAAFSYGVLEELRRTDVKVDGRTYNLLSEVDALSLIHI